MKPKQETKIVVFKNNIFKKVLLSLTVIAVCGSLQFTSCKKKDKEIISVSQTEIQALKDFYKAPGGGDWTTIKWGTTRNDVNYWINVHGVIQIFDTRTNEYRIGGIDLFNNNLTSEIPIDILLKFTNTKVFSLDLLENNITGNILEALSQLNLVELNLSWNNLIGTLPQAIKNMTNYSKFVFCPQKNDGDNCSFRN